MSKSNSNEENEIYDNKDKSVNSQNYNSITDNKKFKSGKKENLNLPLITSTNIEKSLINEYNKNLNTIPTDGYRENHALRFSKYLPRKAKLNSNNNKLSYIEPHNYALDINKGFDFSKMQSRNEKSILNMASLDVPSSSKYFPKYNLVENNAKNILFSPFGTNKKNKKVLLKKMLGSYKVFPNYQFIDNNKLFKDKDIINQKLIINHNIHPWINVDGKINLLFFAFNRIILVFHFSQKFN